MTWGWAGHSVSPAWVGMYACKIAPHGRQTKTPPPSSLEGGHKDAVFKEVLPKFSGRSGFLLLRLGRVDVNMERLCDPCGLTSAWPHLRPSQTVATAGHCAEQSLATLSRKDE